jgi:hypothetical protein
LVAQISLLPLAVRPLSITACRFLVVSGVLMYLAAVVAMYVHFKQSLIWISLVIVLNLLTLITFGHYMIRSILFPYSNYFIKKQLDSVINRRFSQEFGRLLQQVHKCLRIMAEQDGPETFAEFRKRQQELD